MNRRLVSLPTYMLVVCVALACTPRKPIETLPEVPPPTAAKTSGAEGQAAAPAVMDLRVLLVSFGSRSETEARDRAATLAQMGRSGESFPELTAKYSDRPHASEDLGVVRVRAGEPSDSPNALEPAVIEAARALPVDGISEPVRTSAGYVVVQRMADPPAGPAQIAAKHILIGYAGAPHAIEGATRSEAEARALAEQIVKEARAPDADWDALAKKYTEEPGGKDRAGDLGTFGHGQMVPAFEKAAFALDVGQVSDVVQSPFGFHVIRRYQ